MQIIKTEQIEFSKTEYEAIELVMRMVDRLQYAASNPSIILAAKGVADELEELLGYCVPLFREECE